MGYKTTSAERSQASSAVSSAIAAFNNPDGSGFALTSTALTADKELKQYTVVAGIDPISSETTIGGSGSVITSVVVTDSNYAVLDDTAVATTGGYIKLTGSGFKIGCVVYVAGAAASTTTFVSSTEVRAAIGALASNTHTVYLLNTDGSAAFYLSGLLISGVPSWSTGATLTGAYEQVAYSQSLTATGDATISYSLKAGSTLPTGVSLNSTSGLLSGTTPVEASGSTTYTFTIIATDGQNQDTERLFSLTISHDVVTWSTPADGTIYSVTTGDPIAAVTLSASSAAGKSVTYAANALPTGLSLTANSIAGTPTVAGTTSTLITATAANTSATATRTISWAITVAITGDPYAASVSLYLNGETTTPTWLDDASDNNLVVTNRSDFRTNAAIIPTARTPYNKTTYPTAGSAWFAGEAPDGPGAYDTLLFQMPAVGTVFTVEFWFYADEASPGLTATKYFLYSNSGFNIGIIGNRGLGAGTSGTAFQTATGVFSAYTWNHVAVVRTGTGAGEMKMYLNGTLVTLASGAFTGTHTLGSAEARIGGSTSGYQNLLRGNIADFRIVDGTAVYTANFAAPTVPLTAISGTAFLALQYKQGTTNSGFVDDSTNGFPIIRYGNSAQGSFSPFSPAGWSAYFNGNNYTNIYAASSADFNFGSGNFTIECFFNPIDIPSGSFVRLFDTGLITCFFVGGSIYFRNGEANAELVTPVTHGLSNGIWYHLAFVRSGTTYSIYRDGSLLTSGTGGTITSASAPFYIGTNASFNQPLYGHVNSFRVTNGQALYTTTFTPLTTTSQNATASNVKLLTCQSNRVVDNSTQNTKTILIGDPGSGNAGTRLIQAFSPFAPTVAYSAATHGGSMYFDGTGDYLQLPSSTEYHFTGDFTIEFWMYAVAITNEAAIVSVGTTDPNSSLVRLSSDKLQFWINGSPSGIITCSTTIQIGQWYHVAWVRSGSSATNVKIYLNGVQDGVTSSAKTATFVAAPLVVARYGSTQDSGSFNGYISDLRLNNTALYTSTFTPPTAPLTAVSGTKVLIKGTNAGIVDRSGRNVIETVGYTTPEPGRRQPEIRTQVKKYGDGSIFFGGTGDYLLMNGGQNFAFGTGNFTVEFWVNITDNGVFYDSRPTSTDGVYVTIASNDFPSASGNSVSLVVSGSRQITGTTVIKDGTWHHVAVCRSATTTKLFVDGVQTGSSYSDSNNYLNGANRPVIASQGYTLATALPIGYMDDIRITKGVARYTANFTPPTASFNVVATATRNIEYLVVGAGGGGGHYHSGGGGGGGVQASTVAAATGVTYTVTVGAGGASGGSTGSPGANGNSSSITGERFGIQATGGQGGGGINGAPPGGSIIMTGGKSGAPPLYAGGASTVNVGGVYRSGGGVGAGAVGVAGASGVNPDGGVGAESSITGTNILYGGGGGGGEGTVSGNWGRGSPFTLGIGGGGAGGGNPVASNRPGDIYGYQGAPGIANLGGGGGGPQVGDGGTGGSGVVIIKTADSVSATTTGSPTVVTSGGYTIYTFNSTGTIAFS